MKRLGSLLLLAGCAGGPYGARKEALPPTPPSIAWDTESYGHFRESRFLDAAANPRSAQQRKARPASGQC